MATKKPSGADLVNLGNAVATTNGTGPTLFATAASMEIWKKLAGGPYVESNPDMKDPTDPNKIAFRATPAGVEYFRVNGAGAQAASAAPATQGAAATASEPMVFVLEDAIPIPPLKRGGRGSGVKYPFETMNVNQSFFIPKTETNPKPSKRIAAVVSTASKNLAPKRFKVQAVIEQVIGAPAGTMREGARIWRVADEVAK